MNEAITKFVFQGDELDVVRTEDGDVAVPLRRLCGALGVDVENQRKKLKGLPWAVAVMITATGPDGKSYEMLCLHRRSIPLWAATIHASKVHPELREKLTAYQCEAAEVLADHFLGKRGAPSNAVTESAAILQQQAATLRDVPPMLAEMRKQIGLTALVQRCPFARVEGALRKAFRVTGYTHLAVANYGAALALIAPMTDKVFLLGAPPKSGKRQARLLRLVDARQTKLPWQ